MYSQQHRGMRHAPRLSLQRSSRLPTCRRAINRFSEPYQPRGLARHRTVAAGGIDLSALDLDIPDIDGDLKSVQRELGATFDDNDEIPLTYGNARQAVDAPASGVALVDRSHWPRILLQGRDRGPLLQRFSSHDFTNLRPGQGCDTVLLGSDGHAVDLVTALLAESHTMLLVSPGNAPAVTSWVKQQAAAGELKVQVMDVSRRSAVLSLVGPESENVLRELTGGEAVPGLTADYASHTLLKFQGTPVLVAVGCGLPCPGFTIICDESVAGQIFSIFATKGCILMGEEEWECSRVLSGRPAVASELGPGRNPLAAGLYHAVSLQKVVGYEGLQSLVDAEAWGLQSQLWGLQLEAECTAGAPITVGGEQIGNVTSSTTTPTGNSFALGYVQTASPLGTKLDLREGMAVEVGGSPATLSNIPFASRKFLKDLVAGGGEQKGLVLGPGTEVMAKQAEQERLRLAEEAAAAEQARLQRMKESQERLAAWQAQQMGSKS